MVSEQAINRSKSSITFGKRVSPEIRSLTFIVGDGSTTNMWPDPWIPNRPLRPCSEGIQEEKLNANFNAMGSD